MKTIRQAIPNEEIAANMRNEARSCKSSRYSRTPTYISEMEADARVAIVGLTFGSLALIATCLGLWAVWHTIGTAQAHEAPVMAKSEMTKQEIKALNIAQAKPEKHHAK